MQQIKLILGRIQSFLSTVESKGESPDSTLKPEHKSLKTSGVAVATDEEPIVFGARIIVSL